MTTVYHNEGINQYILIINCLLKNASQEVLNDNRIHQLRETAKILIREINNDKHISDEMRAIIPFMKEFQSLVEFVNRDTYSSPYEDGYFHYENDD